jgi:tetratricopeptide (TPR) repeat protein
MAQPVPRASGSAPAQEAAESAIRRYEERLARDPASLAFAPLADAYRKAGRSREAIRICREGLRRYPHYATARLLLAKAYLDEGERAGAMAELEALVQSGARDAEPHRLLAQLCRAAGRLDEAVAHLAEAARLDPADRESRAALDLMRGDGRLPEGSPLAGILADDTFATLSFGTACLEQGLVEEAAHVFVRLLRRNPGEARAGALLERALRARAQKRKGP